MWDSAAGYRKGNARIENDDKILKINSNERNI